MIYLNKQSKSNKNNARDKCTIPTCNYRLITNSFFSWQRFPVIASSGAGKVEHFSEVFEKTDVEAALAAGIFHREEVPIEAVKEHMRDEGIETR